MQRTLPTAQLNISGVLGLSDRACAGIKVSWKLSRLGDHGAQDFLVPEFTTPFTNIVFGAPPRLSVDFGSSFDVESVADFGCIVTFARLGPVVVFGILIT